MLIFSSSVHWIGFNLHVCAEPAGGQWQEITRMDEPNMASAPVIRDFLQEGFRQ